MTNVPEHPGVCASELCADVYRRQSAESQSMADEMISLMIGGVGCSVAARTHTLEITSTLAGVTLKVHGQRDCSLSHGKLSLGVHLLRTTSSVTVEVCISKQPSVIGRKLT